MSSILTKLGLPVCLQPKALLAMYECGYGNESGWRGRRGRRSDGAARDRVIGFGKHKGKMLGSLPSSYLKWVSKNLRAREFEEWAILADLVLEDPVYQDRIEWEFAYNILSDGNKNNTGPHDVVSQLLDISDRFGWDWDNTSTAAWRDVNFELLGTSKGGRIPRRNKPPRTQSQTDTEESKTTEEARGGGRGKRRERRDRLRMKREKIKAFAEKSETKPIPAPRINHPFPGRKTLLNRFTKTK